jgi:hypothetical protein
MSASSGGDEGGVVTNRLRSRSPRKTLPIGLAVIVEDEEVDVVWRVVLALFPSPAAPSVIGHGRTRRDRYKQPRAY